MSGSDYLKSSAASRVLYLGFWSIRFTTRATAPAAHHDRNQILNSHPFVDNYTALSTALKMIRQGNISQDVEDLGLCVHEDCLPGITIITRAEFLDKGGLMFRVEVV